MTMSDIYSYIKDNYNIVTDYIFKRDYILNPLRIIHKQRELPYKEDLDYLYNTLHLSIIQISKLMNIHRNTIKSFITHYNITLIPYIKRTKEELDNAKLLISKYNITDLKRDYITNPLLYDGNHYENPYKEDVEYLYKIVKMKREDIINYFGLNDVLFTKLLKHYDIKRQLESSLKIQIPSYEELYNKYVNQNLSVKDLTKHYNVKKSTLGNWLKQYNIVKGRNKSIINMYKTNIERYGVAQPSFSQAEEQIYNKIKSLYNDVQRHYKSQLYPFHCDFYIPSIDTYIEYQGYWTHGPYNYHKPFDPTNKEHLSMVKFMKEKNSDSFNNAINVWTVTDPLKRQIAKDNHLNYIEWFTMDDFNQWFENAKNNIDNNI